MERAHPTTGGPRPKASPRMRRSIDNRRGTPAGSGGRLRSRAPLGISDTRIGVVQSDPFDIAQCFIEQFERSVPLESLKSAFEKATHDLGFRYFACGSHVDPLNPPPRAVMYLTYPQEWVQHFSETRCHIVDPVFRYASRTMHPFSWDNGRFLRDLTDIQHQILAEARTRGVVHGYTVPIHHPRTLPGSCSVIPDSNSLTSQHYHAVYLIASFMYDAMSLEGPDTQPPFCATGGKLSRRERECLELAAQGKTDWAIGRILGLSETTVHTHIERAKLRLRVATRVQAVVQALFERQISFGDVIRADHPAEQPATRDNDE
jgi:DNA-binding CsgD family transcriptional regulator